MDESKMYLIAYDIPNDKRRTAIADILLSYGWRIQASVFIAEVRGAKFIRMKDSVLSVLDKTKDSLIICDLGQAKSALGCIKQYGTAELGITDARVVF